MEEGQKEEEGTQPEMKDENVGEQPDPDTDERGQDEAMDDAEKEEEEKERGQDEGEDEDRAIPSTDQGQKPKVCSPTPPLISPDLASAGGYSDS